MEIMNTFLYKRCKLYRAFFKEELHNREWIRGKRRLDNFRREQRRKQLFVARRVFEDEIRAGHYASALDAAAYYLTTYPKAYIS